MSGSSAETHVHPAGFLRSTPNPMQWTSLDGQAVVDEEILARLSLMKIPPAWTHVWASDNPNAALQATGVDSRGRTQYRYSDSATKSAAERKYGHLLEFGRALPALRGTVAEHLRSLDADLRAYATVARLLDLGMLRIGNERYVRDNHTYGLTTLRPSNVTIAGRRITLTFIGKEHLAHEVTVADTAAATVLAELLEDASGPDSPIFTVAGHPMTSAAVNSYLHAQTGLPVSAKQFRTWGATSIAASILAGAPTDAPGHSPSARAVRAAATALGDTTAVTKASYLHPAWVNAASSQPLRVAVAAAATRSHQTRIVADAAVHQNLLELLTEAGA